MRRLRIGRGQTRREYEVHQGLSPGFCIALRWAMGRHAVGLGELFSGALGCSLCNGKRDVLQGSSKKWGLKRGRDRPGQSREHCCA